LKIEITSRNLTVTRGEKILADVKIDTPSFSDEKSSKRLASFYDRAEHGLLKYLKKLPEPLNVPVEVRFTVTHNENDVVSLYREIIIGSNIKRIADTWKNGFPETLHNIGIKKHHVIKHCICEAENLERSGYVALYPNYRKLIRRKYRPECYYIQDGEVIVFYNPGAIAPKANGIIKFKYPTS